MKQYKVNRDKPDKPDDYAKYKDFDKLSFTFQKMTRRPKPIYRNPKIFFVLVLIAVVAWLVAEGVFEDRKPDKTPPVKLHEPEDSTVAE